MRVLERSSRAAVGSNIARQTNDLVHKLTISVERPFIAVGVEDIGDGREAFELVAVMASETLGVSANARSLEFDVSGQQFVEMNSVIRASDSVGQACFTRANGSPAPGLSGGSQEGLERATQLVFWFAGGNLRHFGCYGVGECL